MSNIESRFRRIEAAFGEQADYRNLCFFFNLRLVDPLDLCEAFLAITEQRELHPAVKERLYAPIPPGTPQELIDIARRNMVSSHSIRDLDIPDEKAVQETIAEQDLLLDVLKAGVEGASDHGWEHPDTGLHREHSERIEQWKKTSALWRDYELSKQNREN